MSNMVVYLDELQHGLHFKKIIVFLDNHDIPMGNYRSGTLDLAMHYNITFLLVDLVWYELYVCNVMV